MRQWWALGRTKEGQKADPGGAPASAAPFSELTSEPEAMSWAEIAPTEVLGGGGVDVFLVWSATVNCGKYFQRNVVVHGAGGRWFEPTQVNQCLTGEVHGLRIAGGWGRMVMVGRKGGGTSPPKTVPGMECSHFFDVGGKEAVEGPDFWLKRSHTYQAQEVQEPEKKNNKLGRRGAVEW